MLCTWSTAVRCNVRCGEPGIGKYTGNLSLSGWLCLSFAESISDYFTDTTLQDLVKRKKKRRKRKQRNPHCRNPDTKKLATPFGTRQLHSSHQIRDSKTPSRRVNIPYDRIQCVWLGLFQNLHPSNSKYFRHSACLYHHNKYVSIPSSS